MRRRKRKSPGGIEGFDDVLFGTTGLIMVLLTWALTQIGIPEISRAQLEALQSALAAEQSARQSAELQLRQEQARRQSAEEQRDAERAAKDAMRRELDAANDALVKERNARRSADRARQTAEEERDSLAPKPCDFVVCIDATKSQEHVIEALRRAAATVSGIGARLSPRFRMGVVTYSGAGIRAFPLTEIEETPGHHGFTQLQNYLDEVEVVGGSAELEAALDVARKMLVGRSGGSARNVIALIGDVGPWEYGEINTIEPIDREVEERYLRKVASYAEHGEENRFLALYTGKNGTAHNKAESVEFFRDVARKAGRGGAYSDDITQLSATLVDALFGQ